MKTIRFECNVELYETYGGFNEQEKTLFAAAKAALKDAYAPYSNFQVGAAVLLENGEIYKGNNQENAAYPSGLCAERTALFYAMAVRPTVAPKAIAVTVNYEAHPTFDDLVSPCGGCRQVLAEYEYRFKKPIIVYLLGKNERVFVVRSMAQLMPMLFSGDILKAFKTPADK